ncbi:aromatic-ring hydroxylase C-terminal domain-containing protein [Streptomyces sp. 2A115]|uniref:aromatic-ring hydroxylase C-terminal domain-containing protein n=1 Tax=Streptomyces sp. 2A115 TaxID=3457439 RepID=UPI003FD510B0
MARALLTVFLDRARPVPTRVLGQITGTGYAYPAPRGAHPLVGKRVPDVALRHGRMYEALRGGRFVLVTPADVDAGDRKDRVVVTRWASDRRTALLVRPDGYVAWAADWADAGEIDAALAEAVG